MVSDLFSDLNEWEETQAVDSGPEPPGPPATRDFCSNQTTFAGFVGSMSYISAISVLADNLKSDKNGALKCVVGGN